jgi:hypothetical protein
MAVFTEQRSESMIVWRNRAPGFLVLAALLLGACGGSKKINTGEICTLNSDCTSPLSCTFGKCHVTCVQTRDCPVGQSCVKTSTEAVCQLTDEAECQSKTCAPGLVCAVDYRCRVACQSGANCTSGQVCVGGVCADADELSGGLLPVKNPNAADPGTVVGPDAGATPAGKDAAIPGTTSDTPSPAVAGGDAGNCTLGPGGYCWELWTQSPATSPAATAVWATPPTPSSVHLIANSGVDTVAGAGLTLRKDGAAVDLGKFDQMWFDADVPAGKLFDVGFSTGAQGGERPTGCSWTLTGNGKTRYLVDLKSAHLCYPSACGVDRSSAIYASFNSSGWGTTTKLDITVTGIGFLASTSGFSSVTTAGSPGQGLNGWCTSLFYWGLASPSWVAPPNSTSVAVQVMNTSTAGTGGALFELPAGLRDLRGYGTLEIDADVKLDKASLFKVQLDGIEGALCQYDRVPVAGNHTYSIDLATPSGCQTGQGHPLDWSNVYDISIGSNWKTAGNATFTITRLALKPKATTATPDAGVGRDTSVRPVDAASGTGGTSGSDAAVGTGGATGTGGVRSTGGTNGGGGTTEGASSCPASTGKSSAAIACAGRAKVATGSPALIDDFSDGDVWTPINDGRYGPWWITSDGSGTQTPQPFQMTSEKACMSASMMTGWGAGMYLGINNNGNGYSCRYDASVYNGISFLLSGTVKSGKLHFTISTATIENFSGSDGICACPSACGDHFGAYLAPTAGGQRVTLKFSDLRQDGYGTPVTWTGTDLLTLNWTVSPEQWVDGKPVGTVEFSDICIDDVSFF